MLTEDYTFRFDDNGVILNTDPHFPFVDITKVSGLDNAELRITEREREDMDGGFVDALFEKMRTIILEGTVYGDIDFLEELKVNFAPSAKARPFYFMPPNLSERVIFAKSLGLKYDWDSGRHTRQTNIQIQLKAEDPSIYGALITGDVGLGGVSGGFGFPLGFPMGFGGAVAAGGSVAIPNYGNRDADCTFIIPGNVTNPAILHEESGRFLKFNILVEDTQTLTVNLRNRTVLLNNANSRRGSLLPSSRWFMLSPGNNTVRYLGTSTNNSRLQYLTRPAYR